MSNYINFTTPIYYTNGQPHIGHLYTTTLVDVYKKFYELLGYKSRMTTGTDEHGLKILKTATAMGITPQELVDKVSGVFRSYWEKMGVSFDDFIRTTEERHIKIAQRFWDYLVQKGDIYLGKYDGLYCVSCEQYYKESELLPGNVCPIHERPCDHISEESYFFKLSKYQDKLLEYIHSNPDFIQPTIRRNEVLGFLENEKLQDISISRNTFDWGIPVPNDPTHVMYVWFDALISYISSLGGPESSDFENYWTNTFHFIGKDILRFHAVYWPAMLLALDLPLPKGIVAHGWWNIADKKISKSSQKETKSLGEIIENVTIDGLRFYITSDLSLERDGNFDYHHLIETINTNLSNNLGNLFNRVIVLCNKYFEGELFYNNNDTDDEWTKLVREKAYDLKKKYISNMTSFRQFEAIGDVMQYCAFLNEYITNKEPWKLIKDPTKKDEVMLVLSNIAEGLKWVATFIYPFTPNIAKKMNNSLFHLESFEIPNVFSCEHFKVSNTDILFKRIELEEDK